MTSLREVDLGYHGNKFVRYIERSVNNHRYYKPIQLGVNTNHKFHDRNLIYWQ